MPTRRRTLSCVLLLALILVANAQDRSEASDSYARGLRRYASGDYDGAIADFSKAIVLRSRVVKDRRPNRDWRNGLASDESLGSDGIAFIDPLIAEIYADRALARFRKGDYAGAVADCDRAITINPGLLRAVNNRAMIRWTGGDLDGAIADLNQIIRKSLGDALAYDSRGCILMDKGDLAAAIADFDEAIRLRPAEADFYCNRGHARWKKNDFDGALTDLDRSIHLNPKLAWAYYGR